MNTLAASGRMISHLDSSNESALGQSVHAPCLRVVVYCDDVLETLISFCASLCSGEIKGRTLPIVQVPEKQSHADTSLHMRMLLSVWQR